MKLSNNSRRTIASYWIISNVKKVRHLGKPTVRHQAESMTKCSSFDRDCRFERLQVVLISERKPNRITIKANEALEWITHLDMSPFIDTYLYGHRQHGADIMVTSQRITRWRVKNLIHTARLVVDAFTWTFNSLVRIKNVTCIKRKQLMYNDLRVRNCTRYRYGTGKF